MTPFGKPVAFRLEIDVRPPEPLDHQSGGPVRLVQIAGGKVSGAIDGRILPGGADWQTLRSDGTIEIEARYLVELVDGTRLEVLNRGLRGPGASGFWSSIWLRSEAASLAKLTRTHFIAFGQKLPDCVAIDAYAPPEDSR
jgi:hypothetical protein